MLPPNQRSICRFMNCFNWVEWANNMMPLLDENGRLHLDNDSMPGEDSTYIEDFKFIKKYEPLVKELGCVMECFKYVMEKIKKEGLSLKTCYDLRRYIRKNHIYGDNVRLTELMVEVMFYLKDEVSKLKSNEVAHNISSDIIESFFGVYKDRKSPNKLYGITPFVLFIPAHAGVCDMHDCKTVDFKRIFTDYHLKDVDEWTGKNLLTNWVAKRQKLLNVG